MLPVTEIRRVGVVGCGLMGAGFAEVCARAGLDVRVLVSSDKSKQAGRQRVSDSLDRLVHKGKLTEDEKSSVLGRISFAADPGGLADRQWVLECVTEHEQTKFKVMSTLDRLLADPDAVIASNTSSLSITKLARATERPDRVIGTHFFYPIPVLRLVEVTSSLLTSDRTRQRTESFLTGTLGKDVIRSRDRSGFVVNALFVPYLMSAIRMVESGFATAEDIDKGMTLGCAHPMGPLRLADLIGLDTLMAVALGLYDEFKEPLYSPPPLLCRMVDGGLLGSKSGRGFYDYP